MTRWFRRLLELARVDPYPVCPFCRRVVPVKSMGLHLEGHALAGERLDA